MIFAVLALGLCVTLIVVGLLAVVVVLLCGLYALGRRLVAWLT